MKDDKKRIGPYQYMLVFSLLFLIWLALENDLLSKFIAFFALSFILLYFARKNIYLFSGLFLISLSIIFLKHSLLQSISLGIYLFFFSFGIKYLTSREKSFSKIFLFTLIFLLTLFSSFIYADKLNYDNNILSLTSEKIISFFDYQKELFKLSELDQSVIEKNLENIENMKKSSIILIPSIVIIFCGIVALGNLILDKIIFFRGESEVMKTKPFIQWRMPWYFIWGFLLGLAGELLYYQTGVYADFVYYFSLNSFTIFNLIFFIQGLSIMFSFFHKYDLKLAAKIALSLTGFLLQMFFLGITWIGVFDVWFDFRILNERVKG